MPPDEVGSALDVAYVCAASIMSTSLGAALRANRWTRQAFLRTYVELSTVQGSRGNQATHTRQAGLYCGLLSLRCRSPDRKQA